MKTSILAAFLLIASASAAFCETDANQLYLDGLSLYQSGKYAGAEKKFMEALGKNPRHLSSLYMMGETLSRDIRRLREAEGWYKKALRDGGKDKTFMARSCFSLGVLYMQMGLYAEASRQFQELISGYPDFYDMPKTYNHLGVVNYRLDNYDEALDCFKKALKRDPTLREATFNMKTLQGQLSLVNRARYYERMGDDASAQEQYEKAIDAYPNYVAAWYHLGLMQLRKKQFQSAARSLTRARALNPQYLGGDEIPYQLAAAFEGRGEPGDLDEALRMYRLKPAYKDSRLRAGITLLAQGRLDGAEEELMAVLKNPADKKAQAEACYQLGRLYTIKDDAKRAEDFFGKASDLMPGEQRYKRPAPKAK